MTARGSEVRRLRGLKNISWLTTQQLDRLALILLELSEDFGVANGKGIRLTVVVRHKDLAELVGASRPRITEHLIRFERMHLIAHENRRWTVRRDRLEGFLAGAHTSAPEIRVRKTAVASCQ